MTKNGWFVLGNVRVTSFVICVLICWNSVSSSIFQRNLTIYRSKSNKRFILACSSSIITIFRVEGYWVNEPHQIKFCSRRTKFRNCSYFGCKCFNCVKTNFMTEMCTVRSIKKSFSGFIFRFFLQALSRNCLTRCSICVLEFDMSKISSLLDQIFRKKLTSVVWKGLEDL